MRQAASVVSSCVARAHTDTRHTRFTPMAFPQVAAELSFPFRFLQSPLLGFSPALPIIKTNVKTTKRHAKSHFRCANKSKARQPARCHMPHATCRVKLASYCLPHPIPSHLSFCYIISLYAFVLTYGIFVLLLVMVSRAKAKNNRKRKTKR